jgi:hypothetical protein
MDGASVCLSSSCPASCGWASLVDLKEREATSPSPSLSSWISSTDIVSEVPQWSYQLVLRNSCLAVCLLFRLGEYWFRISCYVYDPNRPLAPILRQSRCSLMCDVYLTCIDDDEQVLHIQRDQNTWNTILDQDWIFFFWTMNNEKQKNWMKTTVKQKMNKIEWKSNNNK